jgi:hypothetical protein
MRGLGYAVTAASTFALTFGALHEDVPSDELTSSMQLLIASVAVAALGGAAALLLARRRAAGWELLAIVTVTAVALIAAFAPASPAAMTILFNLLLAGLALGAVVVGYREDELWLATSGLVVVTIDVFARFVDFSWGFLPRSTGFLAAGLLLIALALVLERGRSRLATRMATR